MPFVAFCRLFECVVLLAVYYIKMNVCRDKQKCCVRECLSTRKVKFHQFPKKESLGLLWLNATNNFDLLKLTYEEVLKRRYVICCLHFKPEDYIFGARKKLKEGTVPSLLLPEVILNNESSSNEPNVDINCKGTSSKADINCSPTAVDFSPLTLRKQILDVEGSPACRQSSLTIVNEPSHCTLTSTPKSHNKKSGGLSSMNRMLFSEHKESSIGYFVTPEIVNNGNDEVPIPSCVPSLSVNEEKSSETFNSVNASSEMENKSMNSFKSRGSKRLVWRAKDLDEKTRKMYDEVLSTRKERDISKLKCIRYENRMRKICENAESKRFHEELDKLTSFLKFRQLLASLLQV